jgi:ABC-type transporter Mla subunit MlaD
MLNLKKLIVPVIFFLLFSCSNDSYSIYVFYTNVEGFDMSSEVLYKGLKVGNVEKMTIHNDGILVKLNIKNEYVFSKESTWEIKTNSLIGPKIIDIRDSDGVEKLTNNDTIIGLHDAEADFLKFKEKNTRNISPEELKQMDSIIKGLSKK